MVENTSFGRRGCSELSAKVSGIFERNTLRIAQKQVLLVRLIQYFSPFLGLDFSVARHVSPPNSLPMITLVPRIAPTKPRPPPGHALDCPLPWPTCLKAAGRY